MECSSGMQFLQVAVALCIGAGVCFVVLRRGFGKKIEELAREHATDILGFASKLKVDLRDARGYALNVDSTFEDVADFIKEHTEKGVDELLEGAKKVLNKQ
jgi:hypothetical protein